MPYGLYNEPNTLNNLLRAAHPHGGTQVVSVHSPSGGEGYVEDSIEQQIKMLKLVYTQPTARVLANLANDIDAEGLVALAGAIDGINRDFIKLAEEPNVFQQYKNIRDKSVEMIQKPGHPDDRIHPQVARERMKHLGILRDLWLGHHEGQPAPQVVATDDFKPVFKNLLTDVVKNQDGKRRTKEERALAMRVLGLVWGTKDPQVTDLMDNAGIGVAEEAKGGERERQSGVSPQKLAQQWKDALTRIVGTVDKFNQEVQDAVDGDTYADFSKTLEEWGKIKTEILGANYGDRDFQVADTDGPLEGWLWKTPVYKTNPFYAAVKTLAQRGGSVGPSANTVLQLLSSINLLGQTRTDQGEEITAPQMLGRVNQVRQIIGITPIEIPAPAAGYEPTASEVEESDVAKETAGDVVKAPAAESVGEPAAPATPTEQEPVPHSAPQALNTAEEAEKAKRLKEQSDVVTITSPWTGKEATFDWGGIYNIGIRNPAAYISTLISYGVLPEGTTAETYIKDAMGPQFSDVLAKYLVAEREYPEQARRGVRVMFEKVTAKIQGLLSDRISIFDYAKRHVRPVGPKKDILETMMSNPEAMENFKRKMNSLGYSDEYGFIHEKERRRMTSHDAASVSWLVNRIAEIFPKLETKDDSVGMSDKDFTAHINQVANSLADPALPPQSQQMVIDKGFAQSKQVNWPGTKEDYIAVITPLVQKYKKQHLPAEINKAIQEAKHSNDNEAVRRKWFKHLVPRYRGIYTAQHIGQLMQDAWSKAWSGAQVMPGSKGGRITSVDQKPAQAPQAAPSKAAPAVPQGRQGLSAQPAGGL